MVGVCSTVQLCPKVKRVLIIITCITWLLKLMTERREPGVHSTLMFSLKLVAFVSGLSITLFVQHTETYVRSPGLQRSQLKQRLTVFAKIVEFPWASLICTLTVNDLKRLLEAGLGWLLHEAGPEFSPARHLALKQTHAFSVVYDMYIRDLMFLAL